MFFHFKKLIGGAFLKTRKQPGMILMAEEIDLKNESVHLGLTLKNTTSNCG